MTTPTTRALTGAMILAFLATSSLAQTEFETPDGFGGTVLDLSVANVEDLRLRGVEIANEMFLPANNGGHFALGTLDLQEIVSPDVINNDPLPPSGPNEVAWFDLVVTVRRDTSDVDSQQGVMISIDKEVTNNTPYWWTDFHMTVGTGLGLDFEESDEGDNLFFKTDPPPVLEAPDARFVDAFDNPPMLDEPNAPDNLWWLADTKPGQHPGETTDFWLAISVPHSLFPSPGEKDDPTITRITIRQHASIPEPATLALAALAAATLLRRR